MSELSLESLAQRVEVLERALNLKRAIPAEKDAWQSVVGMFSDSAFMREVDEEGRRIREAERLQAQRSQE